MAIKEIPTNFRVYYKSMREAIKPKYDEAIEKYENSLVELKQLHEELSNKLEIYKTKYNINLTEFEEFVNNEYSTGIFYNSAKSMFVNRKKEYIASAPIYEVYKLARLQKDIYNQKHQIDIWSKMLDLSLAEYRDILEVYYNEVHKKLIIDGYGYVFEQPIGWICINRCKIVEGRRKKLNFQATKLNKQKLVEEGKRLWNKEEADYAKSLGLDYNGEDYRVYLKGEVCYEIPLLNCRLSRGERYRLTPVFARRHVKGKSCEQLIKECNNDLNKICELPVDIRLKLKLCLETDNLLYLNFIRNEAQQSAKTPKANRKSGQ